MFCPECGSEYRQGFETCGDCNIPLVHELPQPEIGNTIGEFVHPDPDLKLVNVFETNDPSLVAIAKSLLNSAGIEFSANGEFLKGRGVPMVGLFQDIQGVRFLVREADSEVAAELLRELNDQADQG